MAAPVLLDYEYQYKEGGVKLNGAAALPFVDIENVTGLDMAPISASIHEIDGRHGGSVSARYFSARTIIFEGSAYAAANQVGAFMNQLTSNFIPDDTDYPLYVKDSGVAQYYINCKCTDFKYDMSVLRRTGVSPIQLQFTASDPLKYIDNAMQLMTNNVNYTPTNTGNMLTYPIFIVYGSWTSLSFTNNTAARTVTLTNSGMAAGDVTIVDFRTRNVIINNTRRGGLVTVRNWWGIPVNNTQTVKYVASGGTITKVEMYTKSGWA